jgi:hypothetical protein
VALRWVAGIGGAIIGVEPFVHCFLNFVVYIWNLYSEVNG